MSNFVEIGQNIVTTRKRKGMTQEELAFNADMSISCLRRIEHGAANPTLDALCRIADAINEPFNNLVQVNEDAAAG